MCHLHRRVPSLKASQPCFLLLDFCYWFHLTSPSPPSTAPAGCAAEAMFISPSCVLSHGDNTGMSSPKSHTALAARRCHPKPAVSLLPGTILSPQWAQQTYFQVYAGYVVDEPPHPPIQAASSCECGFARGVSEI